MIGFFSTPPPAAAMADAAIIADRDVLSFDGVDDHVRIPAVPATAAGTIAVDIWIPASVPAEGSGIAYHQGRTGMAIEWSRAAGPGDVQIYAYGYQNSSFDEYLETALDSPAITFPVETWVRYVLTHGGGTYTEYLDGVAIRSGTTTGSLANPGTYGAIGAGNFSLSSTTAEFFGLQRLANVRDWSRKLTAGEVAAIDAETSDLVRSYPLDEGTGSTAGNDGSALSADGTIIGASWVFVP